MIFDADLILSNVLFIFNLFRGIKNGTKKRFWIKQLSAISNVKPYGFSEQHWERRRALPTLTTRTPGC